MRLRFAHLSLHALLGALKRRLGVDHNPAFTALWQRQFSAEPVNGSVFGLLPGLAALPDKRFGFG